MTVSLIIGGSFSWIASSRPDGLEWSIEKMTGNSEPQLINPTSIHLVAENIQEKSALMPDYNTTLAGLAGGGILLLTTLCIATLFSYTPKNREQ